MDKQQLAIEAKFFKGLSDKSRLAILETLIKEEKTVADIVKLTSLTQPNVSAHLACLLECGLVKRRRDGQWVFYDVTSDKISQIVELMRMIISSNSQQLCDCTRY